MSSKPFRLLHYFFKPVWESHMKRAYRPTGQDFRAAKEFLGMNPECLDEESFMVEFQEHCEEFLKSKFEGWIENGYPAWGLLNHYNRYEPKKVVERVRKIAMIKCTDCGNVHPVDKDCVCHERI